MKINLLDRYIFKNIFFSCIGCLLVFMIVWIMPEIFLKTVQKVISGVYTLETGISVIVYELPKVLNVAIPVGMLLGTLLSFDKLSKDFEITVLRGSGFPFFRIIASVIILSVFATCATFIVNSKLLPYSACKLKEIKKDNRSSQFVFPIKKDDDSMDKIIIVTNFDDHYIRKTIVLNFYDSKNEGSSLLSSILISDYVKYNGKSWTMGNAKKHSISKEGIFEEIGIVKNHKILDGKISENAYKLMKYSVYKDRELTNKELTQYIKMLKKERIDDKYRSMLNKYIQRFVHPLMCILFAISGCLLGFSKPREQKFIGMLIAVGIIFGYYITMPFFDLLAEKAILHPVITALIPPIAIIVLIIYLKRMKDL